MVDLMGDSVYRHNKRRAGRGELASIGLACFVAGALCTVAVIRWMRPEWLPAAFQGQTPTQADMGDPDSVNRLIFAHFKKYAPVPSSLEVVEWGDLKPVENGNAFYYADHAIWFVNRQTGSQGPEVGESIVFLKEGRIVHISTPGSGMWWMESRSFR